MALSNQSGYSPFYTRVVGAVSVVALVVLVGRLLYPMAMPIAWAAMLAFMLNPIQERLVARIRRPYLASAILILAVLLVVAGPLTLFVLTLVSQASDLVARYQGPAGGHALPEINTIVQWAPIQAVIERISAIGPISEEEIVRRGTLAVRDAAQWLASLSGSFVLGTFTVFGKSLLMLFLLYFFLRDGKQMLHRVARIAPLPDERKEEVFGQLGGITRAVVLGALATAAIQGTILGVGFRIAGLPSPLVFAAIGAVTSLIPIVGTALVWVPAVVVLAAQGATGSAIFLGLWSGILVASTDNVLRPLLISGRTNASTLLIFVGLLGGVSMFGLAGIFIGPFILTLAGALMKYVDETQVLTVAAPQAVAAPASPEPVAASTDPSPSASEAPPTSTTSPTAEAKLGETGASGR